MVPTASGVLQEHPVALDAAMGASGCVVRAFEHLDALQECSVAPALSETARGSATGASRGSCMNIKTIRERYSGNINSDWERYMSAHRLPKTKSGA